MPLVSGRNRVPNPPAMMTAFMRAFNSWRDNLIIKSYIKKDTAASIGNFKLKTKGSFRDEI
jgi:hypothetical protein